MKPDTATADIAAVATKIFLVLSFLRSSSSLLFNSSTLTPVEDVLFCSPFMIWLCWLNLSTIGGIKTHKTTTSNSFIKNKKHYLWNLAIFYSWKSLKRLDSNPCFWVSIKIIISSQFFASLNIFNCY